MNIASTAFSLSTPILTLKFCRCMMLALLCILLWPSCQLLPKFLTDCPRQTPRQHCRWLCLVKLEMSHSSSSGRLASTSDFCLLSIHRSCKILLCQPWKIMASVTSMTVAPCHELLLQNNTATHSLVGMLHWQATVTTMLVLHHVVQVPTVLVATSLL